jgi:hypothetical protein
MNSHDVPDNSGPSAFLKPLRVSSSTTYEELERELSNRLPAFLLQFGLPKTPAGLRDLMPLLLAPGALEIITDTDLMRGGPGGTAFRNMAFRHEADQLKKTGRARTNVEAAIILFNKPGQTLALKTIIKILSNPKSDAARASYPRWVRRRNELTRVERALKRAIAKLDLTN